MAGRKTSGRRSTSRQSTSKRVSTKRRASKSRTTKSSGTNGRTRAAGRPQDALGMLRDDHRRVSALFERFEKAKGGASKEKIAAEICAELEVHAQLEEEIFYPPVREAIDEALLLDEAEVEHQSAKDLIAQIQKMSAGDDLFEARVTVLGEFVKHHVREEQNEIFPKVRKSALDVRDLGERLRERKAKLLNGSGSRAMEGAEA